MFAENQAAAILAVEIVFVVSLVVVFFIMFFTSQTRDFVKVLAKAWKPMLIVAILTSSGAYTYFRYLSGITSNQRSGELPFLTKNPIFYDPNATFAIPTENPAITYNRDDTTSKITAFAGETLPPVTPTPDNYSVIGQTMIPLTPTPDTVTPGQSPQNSSGSAGSPNATSSLPQPGTNKPGSTTQSASTQNNNPWSDWSEWDGKNLNFDTSVYEVKYEERYSFRDVIPGMNEWSDWNVLGWSGSDYLSQVERLKEVNSASKREFRFRYKQSILEFGSGETLPNFLQYGHYYISVTQPAKYYYYGGYFTVSDWIDGLNEVPSTQTNVKKLVAELFQNATGQSYTPTGDQNYFLDNVKVTDIQYQSRLTEEQKTTWSSSSKAKPEEKEGREITTTYWYSIRLK